MYFCEPAKYISPYCAKKIIEILLVILNATQAENMGLEDSLK